MRKFVLIAAMVLISASAQAGVSRGLTMASNDEPAIAGQPAAVDATADQPKSDQTRPASDKKAEKPAHKRESTEARVIYELHRHGIYW